MGLSFTCCGVACCSQQKRILDARVKQDKILIEFKRVLKADGKLILVNMTEGEGFGSNLYDIIYNVSPEIMGGCRGVALTERLKKHGFKVEVREYYQQMLFPSEVILARK